MSDVTVQKEPDKKQDDSASSQTPAKAPAFSGDIAYNEFITIHTANRLPHLDKGPVKAYAARGVDKAPTNMFVMVCEDHLVPRSSKVTNYASITNPALCNLVTAGAVDWVPAGKEKFCLFYENTLGNPLMKDDTRGGLGMKPEQILNSVIRPIVNVLADMRDREIVHGNIRPANIFDGGMKVVERAVLGECLCLPVSYDQPALYETIERGLTSPIGRGMGTQSDDLYSFGVSLAVLMRHIDPMDGYGVEELIERKMEEGSYGALLGKDRFSGAILELLRGLLHDDDSQRWSIDDILVWMDGRRLSPKQASRPSKANRPLVFNGEKYLRPALFARDLGKNMNEARQLIESGEVEQWLSRAVEDKVMTARYDSAVTQAEEGGKTAGYTERLMTRVSIALHPEGPLRYKSINVSPDGVGAALTEAFVMKRDLQTYIDFFMNYFITQWVDAQTGNITDVSSLISKFDGARAYLRQKGMGGGLERCIYVLNAEAPCLSEKLQKFYVRSPEEMMHAYEKLSKMPGRPAMFFDRHVVAFISAKERKNIDPYVHDLNAPEPYRRILAEMKTLATIQKRSQMERLPGIAGWIVDNLEPVYERFHDRELRVSLQKKAERLKDSGDLPKIVMLFDSPEVYQEDNHNFRRAMRKHHELEEEAFKIEGQLRDESTLGRNTGRQVAALVAGVLAAIIILATAFMNFGGGGGGKIF